MSSSTYKIGQLLYVVLRKENVVYPMHVAEIINRQTLEGDVTTYMIRGGGDNATVVALDKIEGEVFDTASAVRSALVERATASINQLVKNAQEKAKQWYPGAFEVGSMAAAIAAVDALAGKAPKRSSKPQPPADGDVPVIELADGTMARVRLPDALK